MELTFEGEGDFEAFRKAEQWCRDNGISMGSMCRDEPIGLAVGEYIIEKWKNLAKKEKDCFLQMKKDGFGVLTGDKRHGPIMIKMNHEAEVAVNG